MRPPAALRLPRLNTSPGEALILTPTLGVVVSASSMLVPAARTICPPGASSTPSLRTDPPSSMIWPPRLVRITPWLSTEAGGPPLLNRWRPVSQLASVVFSVEATSPATSTRAPWPNSTPCGFNSQTRPLLLNEPRIDDGSLPTTRLSTWLLALSC